MNRKVAFTALSMLLMGSIQQTIAKADGRPDKEKLLKLTVKDADKGFTIDNPGSPDYRCYRYADESIDMDLFFDRAVVGQNALKGIKNKFTYMSFRIYFPEEMKPSVQTYFSPLDPIRRFGKNKVHGNEYPIEFDLVSYKNSQLKGYIRGRITKKTREIHDNKDPKCRTDDMRGLCYRDEDVDIPFEVDFNIKLVDSK